MADFVAVIRRAVDGLAETSPTMRARVYDKARTAVRRQLESMSPRPTDQVIEGQLANLETAIGSVEAEFSEPVLTEEDRVFGDIDPAREEAPAAPAATEQEPAPAWETEPPIGEAPDSAEPGTEAPQPDDEPLPWPPKPLPPESREEEHFEPEPELQAQDHSVNVVGEEAAKPSGSTPVPFGTYAIGRAPSFPIPPRRDVAAEQPPSAGGFRPSRDQTGFGATTAPEPEPAVPETEETETGVTDAGAHAPAVPDAEPVAAMAIDRPAASERDEAAGAPAEPEKALDSARDMPESDAAASHGLDRSDQQPVIADPAAAVVTTQVFDDDGREPAPIETSPDEGAVAGPGAAEAPGAETAYVDHSAERSAAIFEGELRDPEEIEAESADNRHTLVASERHDETFGFNGHDERTAAEAGPRPTPFAAKRTSGRGAAGRGRVAAVLVALLLIGGAAYAAWMNQDQIVALFSDQDAATDDIVDAPAPETDDDPAEELAAVDPDPPEEDEPAAPEGQEDADVSADEPLQKFTQRLLPNGREVDEGPAPAPDEPEPGEGRSLALQSEEGEAGDGAPADDSAISADEIAESEAAEEENLEAAEEAAELQQPLGVGQTMFLYEERLGQRGPTALEGTVVWSIVEESPGGDAPPEEAIRGEISVPEKDLTALLTIKRNGDLSLPASHLMELVFSLPATFEGGGVESVQRVAFKETEQDRGNELIAVPARITDDFFMVALNDYAEALSTNLDLMRERDWIDIPIIYGNGRRALITLDKGTAGSRIFNEVLSIWERRDGGSAG